MAKVFHESTRESTRGIDKNMDRFTAFFLDRVRRNTFILVEFRIRAKGQLSPSPELPLKRRDERTPAVVAVIGGTGRAAGLDVAAVRLP